MDTSMLERKIKEIVNERMPDLDLSPIHFCEGGTKSPEGTYVYADHGKYYFMFTEKGKIKEQLELESEEEVLWNILDAMLFEIASFYASKNTARGTDFRRALFAKEIELHSKFSEKFEARKRKEIEGILKEHPYNDL